MVNCVSVKPGMIVMFVRLSLISYFRTTLFEQWNVARWWGCGEAGRPFVGVCVLA